MLRRPARTIRKAAIGACLLASGCATLDAEQVSSIARPNQAPTPAVTQFSDALQCMDGLYADYGVRGVSVAVSAVPDYTGRVFVGSDIWLQTAITKMSQRSGAFTVTDYNPNPYAPEQDLWVKSNKQGFYIPAYYIRGAISGFANNVAENTGNVSVGSPLYSGGAGANIAYSTVSVDLTVGNLLSRTLISRAHAGNEIVLESKAGGAQVGGLLSKFGTNLEIAASRSDGVPQAVRALVELNAVEILGRLTGVPYWACLGSDHGDPRAAQTRQDVFYGMAPAERVVFAQRRLARLGLYSGPIDGADNQALRSAIAAYARPRGVGAQTPNDFALYDALADWRGEQARLAAAQSAATQSAAAQSAAAPAAAPAPALGPAPAEVAQLPAEPKPAPEKAREAATRPSGNGYAQDPGFDLILTTRSKRPGAPVSLSLKSRDTLFAYCYVQDADGAVARVFPNRWQPDPLIQAGKEVSVPGERAGFDLVLPDAGARETVACFASEKEIGRRLPQTLAKEDLAPLPVPSLDALNNVYRDNARALQGQLMVRTKALEAK